MEFNLGKTTVKLTKLQLAILMNLIDNETNLCDAFVDEQTGEFFSYDEHGKKIFMTAQQYFNTRLAEIAGKVNN